MMSGWAEEYRRRDMLGKDVFALGAWMHFEFESIHPFSGGNGRVGRLLLNLRFLKHAWPPVHVLPPVRERYRRCLVRGHDGNLTDLERFLQGAMARSLLDLLDQVGTREDELKPLRVLSKRSPHSAKYLGLRAGQAELPAIKVSGDWRSSERALRIYHEAVGRGGKQPGGKVRPPEALVQIPPGPLSASQLSPRTRRPESLWGLIPLGCPSFDVVGRSCK